MHVAGKIAVGIAVFLTAATVILLLSADALLNGPIKERILRSVNQAPGTSLSLGDFHYGILANRISCDSLRLRFGPGHPQNGTGLEAGSFSCANINWLNVLLGKGFSCGDVELQDLQGNLVVRNEDRDTRDAADDEKEKDDAPLPRVLLPLTVGRLHVDGRAITVRTHSGAGTWNDSLASVQAEISDLRLEPEGPGLDLGAGGMHLLARGGSFRLPGSVYRITFASAEASSEASTMRLDSLAVSPVVTDKDLFAASRLRATSFRARVARLDVNGVDLEALLRGERYEAGMAQLLRPSVRIMVDMRKEADPGAVEMPNEILAGLPEVVRIDSLLVSRGTIEYGEMYPYSSRPALLRWTDVRLTAGRISNRTSGTSAPPVRIETSAMFQDTARMMVSMLLPLAKREFSLVCHGALTSLPLVSLNSFLEVAERTRIVSGRADSIGFALEVDNGRATGRVRPFYKDLRIEVLAKQTGRNDGFVQRLSTLIANMFKINKRNASEGGKAAGVGLIQYARKPDDPFFKVVWFSLRGGLGSVVGF